MNDGYFGEVRLFGGNFAPRNWAFCDGAMLPIEQHPALYSVLGVQYGGDGRTTFRLPNLDPVQEADKGGAPVRYIICLNGLYPTRS